MDHTALVVIFMMIVALGMEAGWNAHRWRSDKIIRKKDKEIAELKASCDRLQKLAVEEARTGPRRPLDRHHQEILRRIPRFESEADTTEPA